MQKHLGNDNHQLEGDYWYLILFCVRRILRNVRLISISSYTGMIISFNHGVGMYLL